MTLGKCKLIPVAGLWQRKAFFSLLVFLQSHAVPLRHIFPFKLHFLQYGNLPCGFLAVRQGTSSIFLHKQFVYMYISYLYITKKVGRRITK